MNVEFYENLYQLQIETDYVQSKLMAFIDICFVINFIT